LKDEWIKRMGYRCTTEYYLATKRKEILSFATMVMNLEDIVPSKISWAQKIKYYLTSLLYGIIELI
jgi:hypothetical protein